MRPFNITKTILFVLTILLLFASLVQQQSHVFSFKPLAGVFEPTPKPQLTFESCRTSHYQSQTEDHLRENFGFREPLIRLYNQFLYDFLRTTYNEHVVVGKNNWLYFDQNVNDYYGMEMYRWFDSKEEASQAFNREARLMWKLRGVLHEYDIEFLVFIAPEKGFVYPEFLPRRKFDTTSINASKYYAAKFDEYGIPYIEMTKWFIEMKAADTLPYSLFPQSGAHWTFSSVLAADSLFRFMGDLKDIQLPRLQYGPLHESTEATLKGDHDTERIMNLLHPLSHKYDRLYDAEVNIMTDESTTRPSVIFVGTSFLERMYYFIPFDDVFSNSEYWYYNSSIRYGKKYEKTTLVETSDILQKLLDSDYVVWFSDGEQLYKASFGFVGTALMNLCVEKSEVLRVHKQVLDSLMSDEEAKQTMQRCTESERFNELWEQTVELVRKNPEYYFPQLAGDSIPTARNSYIPEALAIKNIKRDVEWMTNVQCQTVLRGMTLEEVLKIEAQNVLNNSPLMRDEPDVVTRETYIQYLTKEVEREILAKPELVENVRQKSETTGLSFEQQLDADARWIVNDQIDKGEIFIPDFISNTEP